MSSITATWGTKPNERQFVFPCDGVIAQPDATLYRGVTIDASPETVFRWLCQMRVAPYSYDWIDNGGRQSPRTLTPDLDKLAISQEMMRIFTLIGFEQDRQLTLRVKGGSGAAKTFGDIVVSYVVVPRLEDGSRIRCRVLVKLIAKYRGGLPGIMMKALLPWGDLIMMRRQLLNFKRLAEETDGKRNQDSESQI